ncbi:hypothetical protein AB0I81_46210 [Nonomuraea sp. NPDC050404]|uniref:hypothetical protein n=1 Tax=Nonomuraea sp. NPDC050404 TaxID=3155783 RepID=UPI0033CCE801
MLQEMIRERLGAIMTNPLQIPNVTCEVCTGPLASQYTRCYRCNEDARRGDVPVARRVVPLTYAVVGTQADRDMYRYKDPMPAAQRLRNPSYQRLLLLLLGFAQTHASCLDIVASKPVTGMTTVPSLRGRPGVHPLAVLASVLPGHWAPVELEAAVGIPEAQRRDLRPGHFIVPEPSTVTDKHILVLEDTWVQGGHAQSAASALLLAGASEVTILVIARRIRTDSPRSLTEASMQQILTDREYSVSICPVIGRSCRHWPPHPRPTSWAAPSGQED